MESTPNWVARAAFAAAGADVSLHSAWLAGYIDGHKDRPFDAEAYQRGLEAGCEDREAGRSCAYGPKFLGYLNESERS